MKKVYVIGSNVITSLGQNPEEVAAAMENRISGIHYLEDSAFSAIPFHASRIKDSNLEGMGKSNFTRFEKIVINSVHFALKETDVSISDKETIFILSTTKGNIDLLPEKSGLRLKETAEKIAGYFNNPNSPLVVSNACISGSLAILTGKRFLESGRYKKAVVVGADVLSEFIVSGFQSFKALSAGVCKPFDAQRDGLSLGEGAATVVLNIEDSGIQRVMVAGGATSNDANHISGPSRTGDGLYLAIAAALKDAGNVKPTDIDYISLHGTGTMYNDEMECKAVNMAEMQHVPVNSLKGFFGHTLGAAGLLESVMGIYALKKGLLFPSFGFETSGVSLPLNVVRETTKINFRTFLKTASGFGGCNAALVFSADA